MVSNKSSLVSVILPVFNGQEYLSVAIDSILSQTYDAFELIIIDDHSIDGTSKILQDYELLDKRITVIKNESNMKISYCLNEGIRHSQGKYLLRMDSDDWSYPERMEKQVKFMENNENIVVSGSNIQVCDENLNILNTRKYPLFDNEIRKKIFRYSPFAHPATIWKTDIVKKVNGYNESLHVAQDYDLYFRMGNHGLFGNINEDLIKLRTHHNSSSFKYSRKQEMNTLYIRLKAVFEYHYPISLDDKLYFFFQLASMFIIPPKYKFWLFNMVRKYL